MAAPKKENEAPTEGELKQLVELVVWEVVPPMAEALIREELDKQLVD